MSAAFSSLEIKIDAVLALCRQLRNENAALRTERDHLIEMNRELSRTIDSTRTRLEAILPQLPDEA